MSDPVEDSFREAVGRLRILGLDHALIGAVALAARGVARATDDIDEDGDLSASVQVVVLDRPWTREVLARALAAGRIAVRGEQVCVPDAADLVLLKLYAGGPNDLRDVEMLLRTARAEAIRVDVDERVVGLPERFRTLWARVRDA